MLERTIAISARHLALPDLEKLFVTIKCPEALLPAFNRLSYFLEHNCRKYVRGEGIQDYAQDLLDGPAPDNEAIDAERQEREQRRKQQVEEERAANRAANSLPSLNTQPKPPRLATPKKR